ncbi:enoyl-CoA hydratase/isomerase family protein [uncultured Castellaniella sp.]|uniref:enoyl-CoA hydratase/isomerase family protein n=1 Tax=uncultured Castellaniella sp. TaxID=647907 RepID=UPI002606C927|nr:enoyl-CoA hydratase/isomerase family protein [uncultured Castellaniella sp.]
MNAILDIQKTPAAWTLTLNRPSKRNALSAELVEALIAAVEEAHARQAPLIAFRGTGKNFSAGFDFSDYEDQSDGDLFHRLVRIEQLLQLIARSPALTLGYAHGRNFGAGVDLFGVCKQRYCSADASFRMPGLKFGLVLGSRRFRDIVGPQHALSILSSTRTFHADEAVRLGFAQDTAPEPGFDALIADAAEIATALASDTRASLHRALDMRDADADADMAALVRSTSRPGLKDRIRKYLNDAMMAPSPSR